MTNRDPMIPVGSSERAPLSDAEKRRQLLQSPVVSSLTGDTPPPEWHGDFEHVCAECGSPWKYGVGGGCTRPGCRSQELITRERKPMVVQAGEWLNDHAVRVVPFVGREPDLMPHVGNEQQRALNQLREGLLYTESHLRASEPVVARLDPRSELQARLGFMLSTEGDVGEATPVGGLILAANRLAVQLDDEAEILTKPVEEPGPDADQAEFVRWLSRREVPLATPDEVEPLREAAAALRGLEPLLDAARDASWTAIEHVEGRLTAMAMSTKSPLPMIEFPAETKAWKDLYGKLAERTGGDAPRDDGGSWNTLFAMRALSVACERIQEAKL